MTRLDQAFLKAYRHGGDKTPPRATGPLHWSPPESHTSGASGPSAGAYGPAVPAPHARFGGGPAPARESAMSASAAYDAASANSTRTLIPTFEVPRFAWPVLVRNLISSSLSEFTALGTELASRAGEGRKTLLVSSSRRGEGRSTLILALAHVAAAKGLRVALVDADFQHPQLAELLNVVPQVGWEDVLSGAQPLAEALVESVEEQITLLPLAEPIEELSTLAGGRAGVSLSELRENFDLVLVDAGPLDTDGAAIDLAGALVGARIDDALVVRETGRTSDDQVQAAGRRLAAAGIGRWEVVENFTLGR